MSIPLFYFKNLHLNFGNHQLFNGVSGHVLAKDRICLIGKNGSGKSTLLKLLANAIEADKGEIYLHPGKTLGLLAQQPHVNYDDTVFSYVSQNGQHKSYLVDIILEKLQLSSEKKLSKLSGGKLRRADLAKTLIAEPDVLLLDEPTNHLDIASIEWLEEYLNNFSGGSIIISHDRTFLRNVSNKTIWLDRGKLLSNNKGYSDFERWSEEVFSLEEKELTKLGKELDKENLWLQYGVTARRKRNQQRLANLHALRERLKNDKTRFNNIDTSIKIDSVSSSNQAKLLIEAENISFKYTDVEPNKIILSPFSLKIMKGEVIGVVGRNGAGKSTLVKLITGDLKPTTGIIKYGANLQITYLDQSRSAIDPEHTLWENICPNGGDTVFINNQPKHVVAYLKDFLFDSKQVNSKTSTLSGGEKNRLLLAKLLINPGNFLILDEPTNDLDMDTLDMLVEILSDYKGSLLIVSHDRDFLERLTTRTIIIDQPNVYDYVGGGYYDYIKTINKSKIKTEKVVTSEKVKVMNKLSYKDERELSLLPDKITNLTNIITSLEQEISNPNLYLDNPNKFDEISKQITQTKEELDIAENRWLELEEMKSNLIN